MQTLAYSSGSTKNIIPRGLDHLSRNFVAFLRLVFNAENHRLFLFHSKIVHTDRDAVNPVPMNFGLFVIESSSHTRSIYRFVVSLCLSLETYDAAQIQFEQSR